MADRPSIVAFQGERGAYGEAASVKFFGDQISLKPCVSFEEVFEVVTSEEADRGVLPVENSLAGSIHRNYDLLLRYDLSIVGEVQVRIAHQLLALPGVSREDVKRIYSHPQALAQCEHSLQRHFPGAERVATYDTAGSAKMVRAQNIRDGAAIASRRAAEIYEMVILQGDLEDDPENYTRFVVVGREPVVPEGEAKTSIVYSLDNEPGILFKSLAVFALRDIDLTKIESRPLQGKRWEYFFYLDFIGSQHEQAFRNALNHLQEITTYFRVLGSYPRGV
ncbi:MAG: prephenate dehydratase [Anaerolineae bacterium]